MPALCMATRAVTASSPAKTGSIAVLCRVPHHTTSPAYKIETAVPVRIAASSKKRRHGTGTATIVPGRAALVIAAHRRQFPGLRVRTASPPPGVMIPGPGRERRRQALVRMILGWSTADEVSVIPARCPAAFRRMAALRPGGAGPISCARGRVTDPDELRGAPDDLPLSPVTADQDASDLFHASRPDDSAPRQVRKDFLAFTASIPIPVSPPRYRCVWRGKY